MPLGYPSGDVKKAVGYVGLEWDDTVLVNPFWARSFFNWIYRHHIDNFVVKQNSDPTIDLLMSNLTVYSNEASIFSSEVRASWQPGMILTVWATNWSLHLNSPANSSTKCLNPTEGLLQVKWLFNMVVKRAQVCVPCIGNGFFLFLLDTVYSRLLNGMHILLKQIWA